VPKEGYLLIDGDAEFDQKESKKVSVTKRMLQGLGHQLPKDHIASTV
jgi:hypothetical protein